MKHATQRDGRTAFEFDQDSNDDPADIWVDETFVNGYNDQRAYLDGKTYEAKEIIKSNWDRTHHEFDGDSKRWVVDVNALDWLEQQLEDAGFACDFDPGRGIEVEGPLFELHEFVEEGDEFTVVYEQKNGEGLNHKEGEVVDVTHNSGYEDKPEIDFRRLDDDHFMYVQFDEYGNVSLFTGGSHAPFVGAVEKVIVHTDEDRQVAQQAEERAVTDGGEDIESEDDEDDEFDADMPWGGA